MSLHKKLLIIFSLFFILGACSSVTKPDAKVSKSSPKHARHSDLQDLINAQIPKEYRGSFDFEAYQSKHQDFDIPYTHNKYVQKWLDYYTGKGRQGFSRHLSRLSRFMPYIHSIADQYGVPKDLVYLSMIESGFNTRAKSWAAAVGPWQFIRSTGALYGLNVDYYMDERRDIEKATHAALRHLKDLHTEFNHWYLAMAAYNAGSGKIKGAIRHNGRNYWDMVAGRYLRQETKDYVPKLLAAATIAKNPAKYGFHNIPYQQPVPYEKVNLSSPTDLEVAARCAGVEADLVRLLNPELLRDMTPPHIPDYALKIPLGTKKQFQTRYAALSPKERLPISYHIVKSGEKLEGIAKKYGINSKELADANQERIKINTQYSYKKKRKYFYRNGHRRYRLVRVKVPRHTYQVSSGTKLIIPKSGMSEYSSLRDDQAAYAAAEKHDFMRLANLTPQELPLSKKQRRKLEKLEGDKEDSLVVEEEGQHSQQLAAIINGEEVQEDTEQTAASSPLESDMVFLVPSQKASVSLSSPAPTEAQLKAAVASLPGKESSQTSLRTAALKAPAVKKQKVSDFYTVKSGDTLGGISKRFQVSTRQLKDWNGSKVHPILKKGTKIRVGGKEVVEYKVKKGDSLYKIARYHSITVAELKKINRRTNNTVRPGEVLVIKR
ncbi:MAG: LysM peptidoglycan-binding domain-containing protein [Deltaproteobacteria bacterium]|nr:LysM peptidoglycan-binding domain-containing protein [Deltaproteobacteria bacterium]